MRSLSSIWGRGLLGAIAMPLLSAVALLAGSGCMEEGGRSRFFTYCDPSGCYQCDERGCNLMPGRAPGTACKSSSECAPGCYCATDSKCAEAGFCDRPTDCAKGYVCNTARHSCEPDTGGMVPTPKACKVSADCGPGSECANAACRPIPLPKNACVFNRECGDGAVCTDGLCQRACVDDTTCGTGRVCQQSRCVPKLEDKTSCVANASCGAGQTCIDGACHAGCVKDSECQGINKNDYCAAGVCRADERRIAECKSNTDCGTDRECVNAQCRASCFANSDCATCTDGTVCQGGYCMTSSEANPQCKLPADCSAGKQHCTNGACAQ